MAKYIRSVKLPKSDLVAIDHIVGVKRFDSGVGLLDQRNRMIGWVEVPPSETSEEKFEMVLGIFDMLINDRRRSEQPDWSFLDEDDVAPEVIPTKKIPVKKSSED
jgi:hypothetical protein